MRDKITIDLVCFTGGSGLTDYSVCLTQALGDGCTLVTSSTLLPEYQVFPIKKTYPFRQTRHYPIDILSFLWMYRQRRVDWILIQGPIRFPLVDMLVIHVLKAIGRQVAVVAHDTQSHTPTWWNRLTYRLYYRAFQKVIVHSRRAQDDLIAMKITCPILIVPHGPYNIFRHKTQTRQEAIQKIPGLRVDEENLYTVLFFGHIERRKGLFTVLDIARKCEEQRLPVRFVIAGAPQLSSKDYQHLRDEAAQLTSLSMRLERIPTNEVQNYFSACDLVLLPYLEGTTSGVLKLAYAFDKPVIASDVGDFIEQVSGSAGTVIPLGDLFIERCVAQIRDLIGTPRGRKLTEHRDLPLWPDIAQRITQFLQ